MTPGRPPLKTGDAMSDGTIYAGISPEDGKPMYTTPEDAPRAYNFNDARYYAANLEALGWTDWRIPTQNELSVLWANRARGSLKGTFNEKGRSNSGWYWSFTAATERLPNFPGALVRRFSDGYVDCFNKVVPLSLRCVRT